MKKLFLLLTVVFGLFLVSCNSDNDDVVELSNAEYNHNIIENPT